jgi:uncharacterized protein (DUF1684 family)
MILCAAFLWSGCDDDDADMQFEFNAKEIEKARRDKDEMLRSSPQSPLSEEVKATFNGLRYFAPDENYVIIAAFSKNARPDTITIPTSKASDTRRMLRYGIFTFTSPDSIQCRLTAFRDIDEKSGSTLFIPFADKTNGFLTYQAGRYLETEELPDSEEYILDFNQAYNPYCAYNSSYACPLVPASNILKTAIRAGEQYPLNK